MRIYDTYNKAKDAFLPPRKQFYFGKWRNFHGLPVWRRGPVLSIARGEHQYETPPGSYGAWARKSYWKEDFLKGCSRFGRLWRRFIPPFIEFPVWMQFYKTDMDVCMKSKYDSWDYEFPPQFSIVFFGLCFAVTLHAPETHDRLFCPDMCYWESMQEWIETKDWEKTVGNSGWLTEEVYSAKDEEFNAKFYEKWMAMSDEERRNTPYKHKGVKLSRFQLSKDFVRPEYRDAVAEVQKAVRAKSANIYFLT